MKFDIDFYKAKAYRRVLKEFYTTMQMTLDTSDFVSVKYDEKIKAFIFKDMRSKIKSINRQYARFEKAKKGPDFLDKLIAKTKLLTQMVMFNFIIRHFVTYGNYQKNGF